MAAHTKKHGIGSTDDHATATLTELNGLLSDAALDDSGSPRDPNAHKASHENGGGDEISVAGLNGVLADAQTPAAHKASHENGGSDEMSVAGLNGVLADAQTPAAHKASHENGGLDEISVAGLNGVLADAQTPTSHAASHATLGGDALAPSDIGASPTGHTIQGTEHDLSFLTTETVLARNAADEVAAIPYSADADASTLAMRGVGGTIKVGDAVNANEAVSKSQAEGMISASWQEPVESYMVVTDANGGGAPPVLATGKAAIVNNWGAGNYINTGGAYTNGDLAVKVDTGWDRVFPNVTGTAGVRMIVVGPSGGGIAAGSFAGKDAQVVVSDGDGTYTFYPATEGWAILISNEFAYDSFGAVSYNGSNWALIQAEIPNHNSTSGIQGGDGGAIPKEFFHVTEDEHTVIVNRTGQIDQLGIDVTSADNTPTAAALALAGWVAGQRGLFYGGDGSIWFCLYDGADVWTVELGKVV